MMTTYFGFAVADSMFPPECRVERESVDHEWVKRVLSSGYVSCCNPQHKTSLEAARVRYGIDIDVPEKAPLVALQPRDRMIVMSVRGLPRLEENRHEYTKEEIAVATFSFGLWTVLE